MSRRTYSLSAIAVIATASLSFSTGDGAEAFAQSASEEANEQMVSDEQPADPNLDVIEIVPLDAGQQAEADKAVDFVSNEVVQELPVEEPEATPLPVAPNASSLRELVGQVSPGSLSEQMQCLAGAVYFEARGEPLSGQLAVAQVVINRAEDRRFPASYCGVVYQRAQFSFVKGGRMPRIRTGTKAWTRAKAIAQIAHEGMWDAKVDNAVYFHAKYVRPKWSYRKKRTAQIDTHIFYR